MAIFVLRCFILTHPVGLIKEARMHYVLADAAIPMHRPDAAVRTRQMAALLTEMTYGHPLERIGLYDVSK